MCLLLSANMCRLSFPIRNDSLSALLSHLCLVHSIQYVIQQRSQPVCIMGMCLCLQSLQSTALPFEGDRRHMSVWQPPQAVVQYRKHCACTALAGQSVAWRWVTRRTMRISQLDLRVLHWNPPAATQRAYPGPNTV